jgi:hypothetical protein
MLAANKWYPLHKVHSTTTVEQSPNAIVRVPECRLGYVTPSEYAYLPTDLPTYW